MLSLLLAAAVLVHYPDPACPPAVASVTLPDPADAACLMTAARLEAVRLVKARKFAPGKKSPCWSYKNPGTYANCLDIAAKKLPAVSYGHSARWLIGLESGKPWSGCAAGISGDPIFVSLAVEPQRIRSLTAWEAANAFLWKTYDRVDLTDGLLVTDATTAALAACAGGAR